MTLLAPALLAALVVTQTLANGDEIGDDADGRSRRAPSWHCAPARSSAAWCSPRRSPPACARSDAARVNRTSAPLIPPSKSGSLGRHADPMTATTHTETPNTNDNSLDGARAWFREEGLARPSDGRVIGGVSAAFARRFGINPFVARVITVASDRLLARVRGAVGADAL